MRVTCSNIALTLLALSASACLEGRGSGVTGTTGGTGGQTGAGALVLSFFSQPNTANVGQTMSAVEVVASDSLGNRATTFTGGVTIAFASNPTGAALSGTRTVRAASGIARFAGLSINRAGTYTLQASASGATAVTSAPFTITTSTAP